MGWWEDFTKSIETTVSDASSSLGEIGRGNFNNLGQTALRGMFIPGMSQDQKKAVFGETGKERRLREGQQAADADAAATAAAIEAKRIAGISSVFEQMVLNRRNAPGRAATMLTGGVGKSLLTSGGNF